MKMPSRVWLLRNILPALLCIFVATLLIALSFSAGCMNPDTNAMWWQATHGIYSDWHPATFSILWTYLRHIYDGTQSMLVLQLLAFTIGLSMVVAAASRIWVRCLLFFAAVAVPSVLEFLGTITKDSVMGCVLVLAAGCSFVYERSRNKLVFACGFAASYLAFALRHNALIAVFPLLFLLFWNLFQPGSPRHRILLAPAVATLSLLLFLGVRETTLIVYKVQRQNPEQRLLLDDLAALSIASGENLAPTAFLLPGTTVPAIRQALHASNGDWLLFGPSAVYKDSDNPNDVGKLRRAWAAAVVAHPKEYLYWRAQVFDAFAGFDGPVLEPYMEVCEAPSGSGVAFASGPLYRTAMAWVSPFGASPFFRPYLYLLLLLAVILFGVLKKRLDFVLIASGAFLYTAGYFFLIQQGAFRYACPAVFVAVVLIARVVAETDALVSGEA